MIRAVLDSNVLVSALIKQGGKPYQILDHVPAGFTWLASEYILSGITQVAVRRHIQTKYSNRVTPESLAEFLTVARQLAEMIDPQSIVTPVSKDLKDNPVFACALDGQADYLASGDRHLLELGVYGSIRIVTPDEFLDILVGARGAGELGVRES